MSSKPLIVTGSGPDWDPDMTSPENLPEKAPESHPAPWKTHSRGNGHLDVIASNGAYVANIFCWDKKDWDMLEARLSSVNRECRKET